MQIVSTARRGENLARQSPVGLATALPKPGRRTVLILEGLGQRKPRAREICALARNASCARPLIVSRAHAWEACEQLQPAKPCHEPVLGRERTRNVEMSSRRYEMTTWHMYEAKVHGLALGRGAHTLCRSHTRSPTSPANGLRGRSFFAVVRFWIMRDSKWRTVLGFGAGAVALGVLSLLTACGSDAATSTGAGASGASNVGQSGSSTVEASGASSGGQAGSGSTVTGSAGTAARTAA